jgi:hypothetical protein
VTPENGNTIRILALEREMEQIKKEVLPFVKRGNTFFDRWDAVQEEKDRRKGSLHFWLTVTIPILVVVGGALLTAFFQTVWPVFRQAIQEYYQHHPDAKYEKKSYLDPEGKVYAKGQKGTQDATVQGLNQ